MFTTIGCETLGLMQVGYLYPYSDFYKIYAKTCLSYCMDQGDAIRGSCNGTGCCHTDIPEFDLKQQGSMVITYGFENSLLNNSNKIDYSPCGFAFVAEKEHYQFVSADLTNNRLKHSMFPVVLDWSVGNQTCEEAKKNNSSYDCKGPNATCHPSGKRPGYLCKCPGFQGNPYHPYGCPQGLQSFLCFIELLSHFGNQSKVPQLPMLSVLRKFSLCVFTAGVNSATHLKTPFSINFSQNRRRRRPRKDPKPWDAKFRSERRFVELETRSPENAPVAGIPRLKTTTSSPRQRHVIATCH
ncbi:hypothetical protein PIB30_098167 [Stylosanthes scabra]|uniref:Uncharacterized protein n=1 Tax=Stylosanthes scabra TaxID=79078 RepID=A0ABU6TXD4_9FABA|nr:hypothetical protein [Stylosanthes scabra]